MLLCAREASPSWRAFYSLTGSVDKCPRFNYHRFYNDRNLQMISAKKTALPAVAGREIKFKIELSPAPEKTQALGRQKGALSEANPRLKLLPSMGRRSAASGGVLWRGRR
jgi:hypothetical protein